MRCEMTHLMATEAEAREALRVRTNALPPMYPIADIRVERRQIAHGEDGIRWVVAGDYSAWP